MPKTKISEFSSTPANNTDIDSINIAEGCAPSNINDAIRELMAQLKDFQIGSQGDSFNGPIGTSTAAAGAFTTLSASSTVSGTGFSTYLASPPAIGGTAAAAGAFTTLSASSTVTLSGGTANGVTYLNGSKVLTSGSALTFDGTNLSTSTGASSTAVKLLNNTAQMQIVVPTAGGSSIQFYKDNSPSYVAAIGTYNPLNNTAQSAIVFSDYSGSWAEQMRLTSTGLGIGTSSPSAKLHVEGGGENAIIGSSTRKLYFRADSGGIMLGTGALQTGNSIYFNEASNYLYFSTASTERMRLDSTGNLGLGVTPSAWTTFKAFELTGGAIAGIGTNQFDVVQNAYYDGSFKYKTTGAATFYQQAGATHAWYTAPSGTAGNAISFTQAMTLDASGNLGLGNTSPTYLLDMYKTGRGSGANYSTSAMEASTICRVYGGENDLSKAATLTFTQFNASSAISSGYTATYASFLSFGTSNGSSGSVIERARIDASGNLLVGTTSVISSGKQTISYNGSVNGLIISESANTSNTTFLGFGNGSTIIGSVSRVGATSAVVYNTTSDYRLKTVTGSVTGQGARIDALKPVDYVWTEGSQQARGFLAHEFQSVYPNSVTGDKDAMDADGNPKYQSMQAATSEVIADLVAEIQSLRQRLSAANL